MDHITQILKYYLYNYLTKDRHGLEFLVEGTIDTVSQADASKLEFSGELFGPEILKLKRSKVAVILGSGPSIGRITKEKWDKLSKFDTFGFNQWVANDYVPNFYLYQSEEKYSRYEATLKLFADKKEVYRNTTFLFRRNKFTQDIDLNSPFLSWIPEKNRVWMAEFPVAARVRIDPYEMYKFVESLGLLIYGVPTKILPKMGSAGSLSLLLHVVYAMGYKDVILCGVDLNENGHFWDDSKDDKFTKNIKLAKPNESGIERLSGRFTIGNSLPEWVDAFQKFCGEQSDLKIYIEHKNSLLYPLLEVYD